MEGREGLGVRGQLPVSGPPSQASGLLCRGVPALGALDTFKWQLLESNSWFYSDFLLCEACSHS